MSDALNIIQDPTLTYKHELLALAQGALRVLKGEEVARTY